MLIVMLMVMLVVLMFMVLLMLMLMPMLNLMLVVLVIEVMVVMMVDILEKQDIRRKWGTEKFWKNGAIRNSKGGATNLRFLSIQGKRDVRNNCHTIITF